MFAADLNDPMQVHSLDEHHDGLRRLHDLKVISGSEIERHGLYKASGSDDVRRQLTPQIKPGLRRRPARQSIRGWEHRKLAGACPDSREAAGKASAKPHALQIGLTVGQPRRRAWAGEVFFAAYRLCAPDGYGDR